MRKLKVVASEGQEALMPAFHSPRRATFAMAEPSTRAVLSDEKIIFDHCVLLEESLEGLKSNPRDREEILEWIQREDEGPYSFRLCAKLYGCDPDELAHGVLYILRKHYRH